ncbi:MAG: class I SAM-dependent rRNA methyltransferase [Planctomycetota bacterium]
MISLRTKPRRHFPFVSRHPWVHAHALAEYEAQDVSVGDVVELLDHDGNWLARGLINPSSRLRVRLFSFDTQECLDEAFFRGKIHAAVARRQWGSQPIDPRGGERLVFSEADGLSGLIVDRYAGCLSVQFTAAALLGRGEFLVQEIITACHQRGTPIDRVAVRMDPSTAKHEGVTAETAESLTNLQQGSDDSGSLIWYRHNDLEMAIDLTSGQKTGGFLDQRLNHLAVAQYLQNRRVLDVCTYTGGFALSAARGGASSVIAIDSSERALSLARLNAERNEIGGVDFRVGDCFDELKAMHERGETFEAVILDPPRFAGSRHQIESALRAYTRLNVLAVSLLSAGGILVTCSCSGRVARSDFLNMLVDVGRRKRRDIRVFESRGPSPDHPFAVSCPESNYLKCLIAQVA